MPPKGWTSGRPEGIVKAVRLNPVIIERIARHIERLQGQLSFVQVNEGMAIRNLIEIGLNTVEAGPMEAAEPGQTPMPEPQAPPAQTQETPSHLDTVEEPEPAPTAQPAIPLALEPAPKTAPPVAVPQAAETPAPAIKTAPALSEDIVKIAEARAQYDKLSERAFIQLLFDRGIYRHQAKDGREVPLPHSTYRDWMKKAREAGLL